MMQITPEDFKVEISEIETEFNMTFLSKLPPWANGLVHGVAFVVVFGGSYAMMQGGAWQTMTLGGVVTLALKWAEHEFGVTAPTA